MREGVAVLVARAVRFGPARLGDLRRSARALVDAGRVVVAGLADDGAGAIARLQDRRGVPVTRLGDIRRRAVRQLVDVGGVVVAILADSRLIAVPGLVAIRKAVRGPRHAGTVAVGGLADTSPRPDAAP